MLTFSAPAWMSRVASSSGANAAADRERHEDLLGHPADHVQHDVPAFVSWRRCRGNQFVGPILLVAAGDLDRVAGVAELFEMDALDDSTAIDVEAGNDPFGQHRLDGDPMGSSGGVEN